MWRIVSPIGELYIVQDDKALRDLSRQHGLRNDYVRIMVGLVPGKQKPHVLGWTLIERVQWLRRVDGDRRTIPVIGTIAGWVKDFNESCSKDGFAQLHAGSLTKLFAGNYTSNGDLSDVYHGWQAIKLPDHGASLLRLAEAPLVQSLPSAPASLAPHGSSATVPNVHALSTVCTFPRT